MTDLTLLALSLTRDASGVIFDTVVTSKTGEANKYARSGHYVGNLFTGWLAGESPETIDNYRAQLARSEFDRFLVRLYMDARRESLPDFQYVRFWQILEILAETRNYDPGAPLLDFEGAPIVKDETVRRTHGSVNIVFAMLRDSAIGSTNDTWLNVNVWFAFRSAVAHHGRINKVAALSRRDVRAWAQVGWDEVRESKHDRYLWNLKEDVKLLLMRKLNKAAPWA